VTVSSVFTIRAGLPKGNGYPSRQRQLVDESALTGVAVLLTRRASGVITPTPESGLLTWTSVL
jgi:hypothetical protein